MHPALLCFSQADYAERVHLNKKENITDIPDNLEDNQKGRDQLSSKLNTVNFTIEKINEK